jgi:DNA polymerase III epsilon subunit-like protein
VFNPELPCHPRASAVHGYDDWTLSHQPTFEEHADGIRDLISESDLIVAHNAAFDMRFIRNEFTRIKRKLPNRPVYCTMQEWRMMSSGGSAKLNVVVAQFGHTRASQRHGALEDAWLAMAVYLGINTPARIPPFDVVQPKIPVNLRPVPPEISDWSFQDADKGISQPIGGERRELQRQRGPRLSPADLERALNQIDHLPDWEALDLVKELQRHDRTEDALGLTFALIERVEAHPDSQTHGVAPAVYERAAIILRKLGRREQEITILERFLRQKHAPGDTPKKLVQRLEKLRSEQL